MSLWVGGSTDLPKLSCICKGALCCPCTANTLHATADKVSATIKAAQLLFECMWVAPIQSNKLFTAPQPCMTVPHMTAGKVSVAVMAAQMLFNSTMWANAFFADMERVETGVECAFQFMAAFAVPAETSDTCALMAYLSRWSGYSMGLIVHLPPEMTPRLLKHISHNVEKLSKASLCLLQCVMVFIQQWYNAARLTQLKHVQWQAFLRMWQFLRFPNACQVQTCVM